MDAYNSLQALENLGPSSQVYLTSERRAGMSDAAEAKLMSQAHMRWMVATLQSEGGKCTYEKLVEVGEEHHCDTVGALLKVSRETLSH